MTSSAASAATCLAIVLAAAPAGAGDDGGIDFGYSITNTLTIEQRADNQNGRSDDDNYSAVINRFNLSMDVGDFRGAVRMDTIGFGQRPSRDLQNVARPERLSLGYNKGDFKLIAGDYYQQLGRGILLSVRKVDEAGRDLSIRGGRADYEGDDHRVTLFAGVMNPANIDSVSQKRVEDPNDLLAGGKYELTAIDGFMAGVHGMYNLPNERIFDDQADYTISGGVYVEFPEITDWLSLYGEVDYQTRRLAGANSPGTAGYLTADVNAFGFVMLFEGLYLNEWEQRGSINTALNNRFNYNQPPTLERLDQEVFNNRDTLGGRLRIERFFEDLNLLLYVNGVMRLNDFQEPQQVTQFHGFGGLEWYYNEGASRILASSGYRDESNSQGSVKTIFHAEADYLQALGEGLALHIVTMNEFRTLGQDDGSGLMTGDNAYERGSTLIGIEKSGLGGLTVEIGFDTQDRSEGVRNLFLAGIVRLELTDSFDIRATGGTQRGGIKCIAGVCRDFPEFAGFRAELIARI